MAFPHQNQTTFAAIGLCLLPWLVIFGGCLGLIPPRLAWVSTLLVPLSGLVSLFIGIWYERRHADGVFHAGTFGCILIGWINLSLGVITGWAGVTAVIDGVL